MVHLKEIKNLRLIHIYVQIEILDIVGSLLDRLRLFHQLTSTTFFNLLLPVGVDLHGNGLVVRSLRLVIFVHFILRSDHLILKQEEIAFGLNLVISLLILERRLV